jgi:ATP-dependent helicase/nuclease subunit B
MKKTRQGELFVESDGIAKASSIPPSASFVDSLARGLLARFPDPLDLNRVTLLLPTRRACRSLQDAFLRASEGRPILLPQFKPLGDVDAEEMLLSGEDALAPDGLGFGLPPAVPPLLRRLLLTRAVLSWSAGSSSPPSEEQASLLAGELGRLIDQVETEGLDFAGLKTLAPERYAEHWQRTLAFLSIVTEHWPAIQMEQGCVGAAELRRLLHEAQIRAWQTAPPKDPVIAAGSTGSIPSTAALLACVAKLPTGEVVLPGLDREADAETWTAIGEDPAHPQHGLYRLLETLGLSRGEVGEWQAPEAPTTVETRPIPFRARIVAAALRPASRTAQWPELKPAFDPERVRAALEGVSRITCADPGEEAGVVALLLREALEEPGRTAALVTPDRGLARRVAAELRRWNVEVDDSAGKPLARTAPGSFLRLVARMVEADFAPLALLACLKHPLAAGGLSTGAFRVQVRELETLVLRGPRPAPGLEGLTAALEAKREEARAGARGTLEKRISAALAFLSELAPSLRPFTEAAGSPAPGLAGIVSEHIACAEALARSEDTAGADRLWAGEEGDAVARFVFDLDEAARANGVAGAEGRGALRGRGYAGLLDSLMADQVFRPAYGRHPRVAILGPLEARLLHADLLVLGSLNEGTWPRESDPGPWMSRPMREAFGLAPLERRVGLAAHDFAQAMGAPRVVLTRALRSEGTPATPSRWLLRLDAFLSAVGVKDGIADGRGYIELARALETPAQVRPGERPAPKPPLAARPRQLSVTQVERWMRDPYAIYARHILGLSPLDPLDQEPDAADRGTLVHAALERFLCACPSELGPDAEDILRRAGEDAFAPLKAFPGLYAFWLPRFQRIASWVIAQETKRRFERPQLFAEVKGRLTLGDFTLTAKADRIERHADGTTSLIDYKTGQPPAPKEVDLGLAPQLPLEAAIALEGGFEGIAPGEVRELVYWRLSGGEPAGEEKPVKGDPEGLATEARTGLEALAESFLRPETPYLAVPRLDRRPAFNDYQHLERIKEWSASGEEEGG